jgi:hypothetical protein
MRLFDLMTENTLIPLPGYELPSDLPWRTHFVALVDAQLKLLRTTGHFLPPRFFGYYFKEKDIIGVALGWTVRLDPAHSRHFQLELLERMTQGEYSLEAGADGFPEYILVHDRRDGACWLWSYNYGLLFVEAPEAVRGDNGDEEESKLPPPRPQ